MFFNFSLLIKSTRTFLFSTSHNPIIEGEVPTISFPISDLVLKLKLLLIYIIKMFVILNKIKLHV